MTYKYEELDTLPYDVRHHLVWDDSKKSLSRFFNSAGSPQFGTFIQNGEEQDDLSNIKKLKELWERMLNNPRLKNRKDPHLKYSLNSFGIEENEID